MGFLFEGVHWDWNDSILPFWVVHLETDWAWIALDCVGLRWIALDGIICGHHFNSVFRFIISLIEPNKSQKKKQGGSGMQCSGMQSRSNVDVLALSGHGGQASQQKPVQLGVFYGVHEFGVLCIVGYAVNVQ
jgi:hypothetical protein